AAQCFGVGRNHPAVIEQGRLPLPRPLWYHHNAVSIDVVGANRVAGGTRLRRAGLIKEAYQLSLEHLVRLGKPELHGDSGRTVRISRLKAFSIAMASCSEDVAPWRSAFLAAASTSGFTFAIASASVRASLYTSPGAHSFCTRPMALASSAEILA